MGKVSWYKKAPLSLVETRYGDIGLLVCSFCTGMVDSITFLTAGTFVGMQTGNTLLLGLATSGLLKERGQPFVYATTLISLGSFWVGCFLSGMYTRRLAPLKRITVVSLFLAQGVIVLIPAGMAEARVGSYQMEDDMASTRGFAYIPPLAIQSGIQVITSRLLGYNEIPVNVLTSAYADLFSDPNLFKLNNPKRNRRIASAILLLLGAICSSWLLRVHQGVRIVLWLTAGIKILVAVFTWYVLPDKEEKQELPSA